MEVSILFHTVKQKDTMKKSILTTLLILLLLLNSNSANATKYAWWVNIEYEPAKTEILKIPISDLDADWVFAEPLSIERDTAALGYLYQAR